MPGARSLTPIVLAGLIALGLAAPSVAQPDSSEIITTVRPPPAESIEPIASAPPTAPAAESVAQPIDQPAASARWRPTDVPPAQTDAPQSRRVPTVTAVVDGAAKVADVEPTVQISSVANLGAAIQVLDGFAARIASPARPQVEPALVRGKTYYRALVTGFGSKADAAAFCSMVRRGGGVCFVRS